MLVAGVVVSAYEFSFRVNILVVGCFWSIDGGDSTVSCGVGERADN